MTKKKKPEDVVREYRSKTIYFRSGELQRIEKGLGRKSNSRDYIEPLQESLDLK